MDEEIKTPDVTPDQPPEQKPEKEADTTPEKAPLEEGRKNALLRYIAVLFAVAFLFVLLSLMMQMRDSRATISELNAASASALKNAEKLQTDNEELRTENADLNDQLELLQEEKEQLELALQEAEAAHGDAALEAEIRAAEQTQTKIRQAYEYLLEAMEVVTPGSQEGNVAASKLLENLELLQEYLGARGKEMYQSLIEGE